jgi:hypothetical protein
MNLKIQTSSIQRRSSIDYLMIDYYSNSEKRNSRKRNWTDYWRTQMMTNSENYWTESYYYFHSNYSHWSLKTVNYWIRSRSLIQNCCFDLN